MKHYTCLLGPDPLVELRIATLPSKESYHGVRAIVEATSSEIDGLAVAGLQLLEEAEYSYEVVGVAGPITLEPSEVFSASRPDGLIGRIRTQRSTGTMVVTATDDEGSVIGICEVEVRSRKLNYLTEYRSMLQRIADETAEAVQMLFAPTAISAFRPDKEGDAETLYQRFAFIQAVLGTPELQSALQIIVDCPHEEFVESQAPAHPGLGLRGGSKVHRELLRSGPRQLNTRHLLGLDSLPLAVQLPDHLSSVDTVPNRFVRHVLLEWQVLATQVADACRERGRKKPSPSAGRGVNEATSLVQQLGQFLSSETFKGLTPLSGLPAGNTVLLERPGYREIYRAYLQADAAARVDWTGADDLFSAGQRDVATLYEYWVFLELARIVGEIPGVRLDHRSLFRQSADRLSLQLRRGRAAVLKGGGERFGGTVLVELWYNRQFGKNDEESWTKPMRPDCSLLVGWQSRHGRRASKWIHFDAKYRMRSKHQIFASEDPGSGSEASPLADDLLRMHAYRDAIRRTSGAYVLYPGREESPRTDAEFHELLPGLGAFVMRPGDDGRAVETGSLTLRTFLDQSIDHLLAPGSDERRADYWRDLVYEQKVGPAQSHVDWGGRPPADTTVLLGFVHGEQHLDWVRTRGLYNLRADDRHGSVGLTSPALAAHTLVLYDSGEILFACATDGTFQVSSRADLLDSGYPHMPGGTAYCCLTLGAELPLPSGLNADVVRSLAREGRPRERWASPRLVTLTDLLKAINPA